MRRRRRGRPHLLCPPCPSIGQARKPGAEPGPGAENSDPGAGPSGSRVVKVVSPRRGRCARPRARLSRQPRGRAYHGRSAPALREISGTEERGHRSSRCARSQDRSREAVSRRGSPHPSKPVSSVRLRGLSTVQCHRICIPRICFSQSYRESKQGRRHCMANLLGGVRPVRSARVLQRSTPVLVPFLLRGQVRLPVILHDSGTLERGSNTVPSRHTTAVSKTSHGPRQRREPAKRKSTGHSSWDNSGRTAGPSSGQGSRLTSVNNNNGAPGRSGTGSQGKSDLTAEAQVRSPGSLCAEPMTNDKGHTADAEASDSSSDSQAETQQQHRTSSPNKTAGSPSRSTRGEASSPVSPGSGSASQGQLPTTGPVNDSQVPNKARDHNNRPSVPRMTQRTQMQSTSLGPSQMPVHSGASSQPGGRSLGATRTTGRHPGNNQQTPQTPSGQPAGKSAAATSAPATAAPAAAAPTSTQRVSGSNQDPPAAQPPSTHPDPNQAGSTGIQPGEPGDSGSKNNKQGQKTPTLKQKQKQATQVASSNLVSELIVPCHSESSLDYMSESTTEITCKWPGYSHQLPCPGHCWLLQHLAY